MQTASIAATRLLNINFPSSQAAWLLTGFFGTESLSELYQYQLTLQGKSSIVNEKEMIGQAAIINIQHHDGLRPRYIHGIISETTSSPINIQGWREYHATLVPPLWLFTKNCDNRIFLNKTVVQIVKELMQENPRQGIDISSLMENYPEKDYTVQYQESTYHFLARLLAAEGIYYYFRHDADRVIWVLGDQPNAYQQYANPIVVSQQQLSSWQQSHCYKTLAIQQQDYKFQTPPLDLTTIAPSLEEVPFTQGLIWYEYPGGYTTQADGVDLAMLKQQAHQVGQERVYASSNIPDLAAGTRINIASGHQNKAQSRHLITSVFHTAKDASQLPATAAINHSQQYKNVVKLIPITTTYRPLATDNQPTIAGIDTATVIGPKDETIHVDKFGRVKVKFHWDRQNTGSHWLRVSQLWAGQGWGMQFIPRINDEVMIYFAEGAPDRPIIAGSHYHGNHPPPYQLPAEQNISGIKTHSLNNNTATAYNELKFDDTLGLERLHVHACNHITCKITNDAATIIGNHQTIKIANNKTLQHNQGRHTICAANFVAMNIGGSQLKITPIRVTCKSNAIRVNDGGTK